MIATRRMLLTVLLWLPVVQAQEKPAEFPQPTGWKWLFPPIAVKDEAWSEKPVRRQAEGVEVVLEQPQRGLLRGRYLLARLTVPGGLTSEERGNEYRPIIISQQGERLLFPQSLGKTRSDKGEYEFTHDDLEPEHVAFFGLEVLTPEGRRQAAEEAQRRRAGAAVPGNRQALRV